MKKLICILIAFATFSLTMNAQAQNERKATPTPEQRAERRAAHLKKELLLTDAQYQEIKAAALEIEKNRASAEVREKAGKKFEEKVLGILNEEQKEKYMAMKEERKEKVKQRMEEKRNEEKSKSEEAVDEKKD
jgi:hypothetical protein